MVPKETAPFSPFLLGQPKMLCEVAAKFGNFKNICFSVAPEVVVLPAANRYTSIGQAGSRSNIRSYCDESVAVRHLIGTIVGEIMLIEMFWFEDSGMKVYTTIR